MIKTIMQRREREQLERNQGNYQYGGYSSQPVMTAQEAYEAWMTNQDTTLLEQIKAGKTPLQLMMQSKS